MLSDFLCIFFLGALLGDQIYCVMQASLSRLGQEIFPPQLKLDGKNIINLSITNEIDILFSAYNRTKWLKSKMLKSDTPNLISCKDIEFMILNLKDTNKIITYFYSKI